MFCYCMCYCFCGNCFCPITTLTTTITTTTTTTTTVTTAAASVIKMGKDVRAIFARRHSYATKSNKTLKVKTPGSRTTMPRSFSDCQYCYEVARCVGLGWFASQWYGVAAVEWQEALI